MSSFLKPLSSVYCLANTFRNNLFDWGVLSQYDSPLPVISIGNVSMGGSGKSPFTRYVSSKLLEEGFQPVILSRGYGGKLKGPHLVQSNDEVLDVGDEAKMQCDFFGEKIRVVVSRKRVEGARFIEENNLGNVIVLDDGFQHRYLARDFNVVLIDVSNSDCVKDHKEDRVFPSGKLRESFKKALKRVDHIVFVDKALSPSSSATFELEVSNPCSSFVLSPTYLRDAATGQRQELSSLNGKSVKAACAIAKPEGFYSLLEQVGAKILKKTTFSDHYNFGPLDYQKLKGTPAEPLVVTEKDAVKLKKFNLEVGVLLVLELGGSLDVEASFWKDFNSSLVTGFSLGENKTANS